MIEHEFDDISSDLSRLNALSDGVISIAMTLLVFNLKVPELERDAPAPEVYNAVLRQVPSLISLVIAFFGIGIWWLAHKRVLRNIAKYDRKLAMLNLTFLLMVALIPFSSALVGTFPRYGIFTAMMFGLLSALGLVVSSIWKYAESRRFVCEHVTAELSRYLVFRARTIGLVFGVAALAGVWVPIAASFIPIVIPFALRKVDSFSRSNIVDRSPQTMVGGDPEIGTE
ncbi:MAG: DUF1211 domain-containing protein [Chthonomonas sp.]|nr:DUF1211 domain-containing protein [Chthonomonas sp.]